MSGGLANSSRLAKLATDAAKPGFIEIKPGEEKEFLKDRSVRELSGIAKNRQRSLAALGAQTFGDVAKLPSMLLKQKFGIWGQQLWLFANGQWNEPLLLEVKDRTTHFQQHDAALRRAGLRSRADVHLERGDAAGRPVAPRAIAGARIEPDDPLRRFHRSRRQPSFSTSAISKFRHQRRAGGNFSRHHGRRSSNPCGKSASRFGIWRGWTRSRRFGARTDAERWGALDEAAHKLNAQFVRAKSPP